MCMCVLARACMLVFVCVCLLVCMHGVSVSLCGCVFVLVFVCYVYVCLWMTFACLLFHTPCLQELTQSVEGEFCVVPACFPSLSTFKDWSDEFQKIKIKSQVFIKIQFMDIKPNNMNLIKHVCIISTINCFGRRHTHSNHFEDTRFTCIFADLDSEDFFLGCWE